MFRNNCWLFLLTFKPWNSYIIDYVNIFCLQILSSLFHLWKLPVILSESLKYVSRNSHRHLKLYCAVWAQRHWLLIWYYACQVKLLILRCHCSFVVLSSTAVVQTVKFLTVTPTTRRQEAMKNYCNSVNCEEATVQHKICMKQANV